VTEQAVCPIPESHTHPLAPPDGLADLAATGARKVRSPNGVESWLVTSAADVRMVLSDVGRFTAVRTGDGPDMRADGTLVGVDRPGNMLVRDGQEHLRLRRPVARAFVVKRIESMRPRIQQIVDEHLDAIERTGPPADLVPSLCLPVPSLVIAELLGMPDEHLDLFQRTATAMFGFTSPASEYEDLAEELGGIIHQEMERKRADGDVSDLIGVLANDTESALDLEEQLNLVIGLLVAGHETTANFTGLFVLQLFQHPDQLERLRSDLSLVDAAVEELLRTTVTFGAGGLTRRATEDVRLGDALVRAGDWVTVSMYANADKALCPRGLDVDVASGAVGHLGFGFGPHQCIGQNLARAELRIILRSLLVRFPGLKLAEPAAGLPYRTDTLTYGAARIPVVW
jgi:cytochrome P450